MMQETKSFDIWVEGGKVVEGPYTKTIVACKLRAAISAKTFIEACMEEAKHDKGFLIYENRVYYHGFECFENERQVLSKR